MKNFEELTKWVAKQGWFGGSLKLTATYENQFEGFYGKASEDWEKQAVIEITATDRKKFPNIKVVGGRNQTLDDVAKIVLKKLLK